VKGKKAPSHWGIAQNYLGLHQENRPKKTKQSGKSLFKKKKGDWAPKRGTGREKKPWPRVKEGKNQRGKSLHLYSKKDLLNECKGPIMTRRTASLEVWG